MPSLPLASLLALVLSADTSDTAPPPLLDCMGESFGDATPTSATFELVAHPSWAAKQVSVVHPPADVKNCPAEPRTEGHGPGLTGLLAEGVMALAVTGVKAKDLSKENIYPTEQVISWERIFSYLSTTSRKQAGQPLLRLAVAVELRNHGMTAWMPTGASLGRAGQKAKELSVWTDRPLPPGTSRHWVMMETELTESEAREVYTLDIWDDSGSRHVSIGHVAFP